jgi:hypothetical protein
VSRGTPVKMNTCRLSASLLQGCLLRVTDPCSFRCGFAAPGPGGFHGFLRAAPRSLRLCVQFFVLAAVLNGTAVVASSQAPDTNTVVLTPEYLSRLSEEMRTNHPALSAADARIEAASANVDAVRAWEDPMARIGGMTARQMMRAEDGDSRREASLYGDEILPRTRAAMESARAGWESNMNSVRDLLDARRMLLEARLMYSRAVAEQYQMMSELVLCCGLGDLNALQMLGVLPETAPEPQPNAP